VAEPICVGWHAVARSALTAGESALVIGAGPIGIGILIALKARGVGFVAVADRTSGARKDAALAFGADVFIDASTESIADAVRESTAGLGADVVFETAGVQAALDDAVDAARPGGRLVSMAVWEAPATFDMNVLLLKELAIIPSLAYANEYAAVLAAIADGRISGLDQMVSSRIPLEEVVESGFEELVNHRADHVKILVHP
jgi:(R,R)-butanediol dehydrogenase/meso-butanediol dehydrogenase/diacetyl reductase